jgi:hypothetical protein
MTDSKRHYSVFGTLKVSLLLCMAKRSKEATLKSTIFSNQDTLRYDHYQVVFIVFELVRRSSNVDSRSHQRKKVNCVDIGIRTYNV